MKSESARGITRSRVPFLALMAMSAVSIVGCSDDGNRGPSGPTGPTGPGGISGTAPISQADTIIVTVTSATVAADSNKPTVNFTLQDGLRRGLTGLGPANVRFTVAKLIPEANLVPSQWRSYISVPDQPDPNANPVPPATPAADQRPTEFATTERAVSSSCAATGGVLEALGEGRYQYTFSQGLPDYAGVSYDPAQTQRVGVQLRGDTTCAPGATSDRLAELARRSLITNGVLDFVPNGGALTQREIIDERQCNACHVELSAHGGGRTTYDYCVTCHNPFTVQSATDTSFDMGYMTHQIHKARFLSQPFPIWNRADQLMEEPFAEVTYPQDIRNCLTCHNDSDSGSSWKTAVTIANCGACHDTTTFAGADPTHSGGPATEDQCSSCHVQSNLPQLSVAGAHARSLALPDNPGTMTASWPAMKEYGRRFKFESITVDPASVQPGQFPVITFKIVDPLDGDAPYNILTDPAFAGGTPAVCRGGGPARLAIDIGWSTADLNNQGSGSGPGQPISLNPLAACPSTFPTPLTPIPNPDGSWTVTSNVAVPAGVTGTVVVALEGHPAGDLDGDGVYEDRIPVRNIYGTAAVDGTATARRQSVDIARCNACHDALSLHGSNRTDEPQVCVICHNPAATDINRRKGATMTPDPGCAQGFRSTLDNLCEQSIDMKRMVHMIHASALQPTDAPLWIYGFSPVPNSGTPIPFAEVTYPAGDKIGQCESCHTPTGYYPVDPTKVQATTTSTGADILSQADDTGITPNTAACSGCHTDSTAAQHMVSNGGSFDVAKPASGFVTSPLEFCDICHGPGRTADVKTVHDVGIYSFDDLAAN